MMTGDTSTAPYLTKPFRPDWCEEGDERVMQEVWDIEGKTLLGTEFQTEDDIDSSEGFIIEAQGKWLQLCCTYGDATKERAVLAIMEALKGPEFYNVCLACKEWDEGKLPAAAANRLAELQEQVSLLQRYLAGRS